MLRSNELKKAVYCAATGLILRKLSMTLGFLSYTLITVAAAKTVSEVLPEKLRGRIKSACSVIREPKI